jgi:hypothetical protein
MSTRFFVALVTAFILFPILGFHRAEGQINPGPKLVEGAKKEGEMIFYTTMTLDQSKEVVDRFPEEKSIHQTDSVPHGGRPAAEQDLYRSSRRQACMGCGGRQSGNGCATDAAKAHCLLPLA